ncbi:MAG: cyclic nucleotide-binding domain-containing protein [Candidatus Binataceae bacterium]
MASIGEIIRGDWPARLLAAAQLLIALAALLGIAMVLTLNPYLLLGYGALQVVLVVGIVLFIIVAMLSQRAMVSEEFYAGQIIFQEGDPGRHMYVIKSGTVEVVVKRADGSSEIIDRLGPGDHFGDVALLRRNLPYGSTVKTVTPAHIFRLSPTGFAQLYANLPELREFLRQKEEPHLRRLEVMKKRATPRPPGSSDTKPLPPTKPQ